MRAKTYDSEGTIAPYRFVKHGSANGKAAQASAATDLITGISDELGAETDGDRVDVWKSGQAQLELGASVTRGQFGTADADGKGVTCAPAAGANARYGCIFEESGDAGDIRPVTICIGSMQGA